MFIRVFLSALLVVFGANEANKAFAAVAGGISQTQAPQIQYKPNATTIRYAFVFDGPSDKNDKVLEQFKKTITKSNAPDYRAVFPKELVFVGSWTPQSVKAASDRALASNATMVISLGSTSSKYLSELKNKQKFVITIDQYGLKDLGEGFFNPVQQSAKGILVFRQLVNFNKVAILMNENFYKTRKNWNELIAQKIPGVNFVVISATDDVKKTLASIPKDCDAVVLTPLFNMSTKARQELINTLNTRKIPTYSTLGREDVQMGALLGSGAYDLDRKVAEASIVNIRGVLDGKVQKSENILFFENELFYINKDTAEMIGHHPHLRIMHSAEIISTKEPTKFTLSSVFAMLNSQNITLERQKLLVKAARRASTSAMLRWLPTFGVTVGYQQYDHDFAASASLTTPEKTGIFSMGLEQVIYSPALVTNILVKRRLVDFSKAEQFLTEQNLGINVALLYIEQLMLENMIATQKECVKESRENLAIARVREQMGFTGREEALRWAAKLNIDEQKLLDLNAANKNLKLRIANILNIDPKLDFSLAALTRNDPALYTSDINLIDHVMTPQALEAYTQMVVQEAFNVAPELEKLKAAIKIKDHEISMYAQRFLLPDAKLSLDYTSLFNRQFANPTIIPAGDLRKPTMTPIGLPVFTQPIELPPAKPNFGRLGIFAQWKPFEGGTKFAEISRVRAEREELQRHAEDVRATIESNIRATINRAVAGYFSIDKNYRAMFAARESYHNVKDLYLQGKVSITHMLDAQDTYMQASLAATNSQYAFFKELIWVQRTICAIDWVNAPKRGKDFIQRVKDTLPVGVDIAL
jgi:outer membrane protein TolC